MAEGSAKLGGRDDRRQWIAVWIGLAIVTLLAIHRLRDFPAHLSFVEAFHGIRGVLPETAWAAIKVWTFWAWSAAVIAGCALKIDRELELSDAILLGVGGLWVVGFVLGSVLGPIGLFNTPTVWGLLALGTVFLWRDPPKLRLSHWTSGQKLAALAAILLGVSMIPLQLGSPVPPFMDVLSYPSSVQRILTFHVYMPFDNDPYGCWGPQAQTPGLELFFALLALGSHTRVATLAETATIWPMAALMIFATYRLGKSFFSDTAGGMAALLLFFTCLFRRAQGTRGTAVDFALVALGLAFFFNRERRKLLMAAGAAMLATAFASHAIIGGFAMFVAASGLLFWICEDDLPRTVAGVILLAGATLMSLTEFAVSQAHPVPYPILPILMLVGIAMLPVGASMLSRTPGSSDNTAIRSLNVVVISFFLFAVLYRHAVEPYSIYAQIAGNVPMLALLCFGGLVAAVALDWSNAEWLMPYAGVLAIALLIGVANEYLAGALQKFTGSLRYTMMVSDLNTKLWDYWCPYFLTLPAGFLLSLPYDRWSRPATFFAVMTLLIYPWYQIKDPVDYDSVQHSITEQWAFNLHTAAEGYWAGHSDRRWTFGDEERPLIDLLDKEIAAGRITTDTHILHLANDISSWSLVQFPVLTGIDDDPIEYSHDPSNQWEAGGRVRGLDELSAAMAARPPYILEQAPPPEALRKMPADYEEILNSGYIRLYRRRDLSTSRSHHGLIYNDLLAFAAIIGIILMIRRRRPPADLTRNFST